MSGSDLAYGAICLRACYAIPEPQPEEPDLTDVVGHATGSLLRYAFATRCPVLTSRTERV
eukprot:458488-Rhodomonas_salina.8